MQRLKGKSVKYEPNFHKGSLKIGVVILIYSLSMTFLFSIAFVIFQGYYEQTPFASSESAVYLLDSTDVMSIATSSAIQFQTDRIVTVEAIDMIYSKVFVNRLPFMLGILSLIVLISAVILWSILKKIQNNEIKHIAQKLELIEMEGQTIHVDPALSLVYERLKGKFEENLEVYKRLNTYLSHEQKNTLAILRSQLEIDQKSDYLNSLDLVSSGIDDILTLSETHESTLDATVDLSLECAAVCDSYRKITDQIEFNFDEEANTVIKAKSRWIYRAISNLVDNAVKFGLGNPITIDVYTKNKSVIVRVKDLGIGIDQEKREHIFNHRYRIEELKSDGHGIGLSLVQHVCSLSDGFVWVESEKNKGTTFYLSFKEYNGKR